MSWSRTQISSELPLMIKTAEGDFHHFFMSLAHGENTRNSHSTLIPSLHAILQQKRDHLKQQFQQQHLSGYAYAYELSILVDSLIISLMKFVHECVFVEACSKDSPQFDVVATGGYGRQELAPYSDIDLVFLVPYKITSRIEQLVEFTLYILWDLDFKVGYAVRSVKECIALSKKQISVCTALLESRLLWGSGKQFRHFQQSYKKEILSRKMFFLQEKWKERQQRHERVGSSEYMLEPNIKEGKGGFRDLQTLFWFAQFFYPITTLEEFTKANILSPKEMKGLIRARNFLWMLRCHMHMLSGRAQEYLTFDLQQEIVEYFTYYARFRKYRAHSCESSIERFMKHYYLIAKDVGQLTSLFLTALDLDYLTKDNKSFFDSFLFSPSFWFASWKKNTAPKFLDNQAFILKQDMLHLHHEKQFAQNPVDMIRLFLVSQRSRIRIHPMVLRTLHNFYPFIPDLRHNTKANNLFLEMFEGTENPEHVLRSMSEAGVLGRFIPEFGHIIARMPHDFYHMYTVDEHTLRTLGILYHVQTGQAQYELPLAVSVMQELTSAPRLLYLALFLHDIAKGQPSDHTQKGAHIAEKLCGRLGIGPEPTEMIVWLIRHHLLMSHTALKRDLDYPQTIKDFVDNIGSLERLRLLLLLTTVDINAVGPGRWNAWTAFLINKLYNKSFALLSGQEEITNKERYIQSAQQSLRYALQSWTKDERDTYIEHCHPEYWLSFDRKTHLLHAQWVYEQKVHQTSLIFKQQHDTTREVTEITLYMTTEQSLFTTLTNIFIQVGANIVHARRFTMKDGMVLSVFWIQDAVLKGLFQCPKKNHRLRTFLGQVVDNHVSVSKLLKKSRSVSRSVSKIIPTTKVYIDNCASKSSTVIEIHGADRVGILYDIACIMDTFSLEIMSAKIATFGSEIVDVFYVRDPRGGKIENTEQQESIKSTLFKVFENSNTKNP